MRIATLSHYLSVGFAILDHTLCSSASRSSKDAGSCSRASVIEEILSRPINPARRVEEGQKSRSEVKERPLTLSTTEAAAIFQDYVRHASASDQSQHNVEETRWAMQEDNIAIDREEGEEADEEWDWDLEKESGDEDDEFEYLSSTRSSRLSLQEDRSVKRIFDKGWKDRGLSCNMDAPDLALGMAKVKIDLLEYDINNNIGVLAANHVKKSKDAKYRSEFRFWSRKYGDKIKYLVKRVKYKEQMTGAEISVNEKKKYMLEKVGNLQSRTYEDWNRRTKKPLNAEVESMTRA